MDISFDIKPPANVRVIGQVQLPILTSLNVMFGMQATCWRHHPRHLYACICSIKTKWNHLSLESHLLMLTPQQRCVVVRICKLKHTHWCVSRLQEHWSLSAPHSAAAGGRVACTMLKRVLFMPTTVSHTLVGFVFITACAQPVNST